MSQNSTLFEANLHNAPSEIRDSGPLECRRKWRSVVRETTSLFCSGEEKLSAAKGFQFEASESELSTKWLLAGFDA